jgi:hypothetical protein
MRDRPTRDWLPGGCAGDLRRRAEHEHRHRDDRSRRPAERDRRQPVDGLRRLLQHGHRQLVVGLRRAGRQVGSAQAQWSSISGGYENLVNPAASFGAIAGGLTETLNVTDDTQAGATTFTP